MSNCFFKADRSWSMALICFYYFLLLRPSQRESRNSETCGMEDGVSPVGREKKGRNGHVGRLYLRG